jgi:acyl carrier protein
MLAEVEQITAIVRRVGKLPALQPAEDFYAAGFSSLNALELLIELETQCGVSIPDERFVASRTPCDLHAVIDQLRTESAS